MPNENDPPKGWLDNLTDGGLPQLLIGPAGKALSRLIGAGADIPAAWLEQKAQAIRDETEARSDLMKVLSAKSAEIGASRPELLDRGLNALLGRVYREQVSREAIAGKTIEHLADEPPPADSPGPTDDWMNIFEQHAANASSDELQETWARVLAGEIRTPGAFSLATLAFIATLDKVTAEAVEFTLGRVAANKYVITGAVGGKPLEYLATARSSGIIAQIDADLTTTISIGKSGTAIIPFGTMAVVVNGKTGTNLKMSVVYLSRIGRELLPIIKPKTSKDAVESLAKQFTTKSNNKSVSSIDISIGSMIGKSCVLTESYRYWQNDAT